MICRRPVLVLVVSLAGAASAVAGPNAATLLREARTALAVDAFASRSDTFTMRGKGRIFSVEQDAEISFDREGHVVLSLEGKLPIRRAYDGQTCWGADYGTPPQTMTLGERSTMRVLGSIMSGIWTAPDGPLDFAEPADHAPNVLEWTLRDGGDKGSLTLDESRHPISLRIGSGRSTQKYDLAGWRPLDGTLVPTTITFSSGTNESIEMRFTSAARTSTDMFSRSHARVSPARFDEALPSALEAKKLGIGLVLVKPTINGQQPGWFIFDTGAGATVLDATITNELNLEGFGEIQVGGVGGAVGSPIFLPNELKLGPVTIAQPMVIALDLSMISAAVKEKIVGIIGYDVLSRVVTVYDKLEGRIELHDPDKYNGSHNWQKLLIFGRRPHVDAEVEGRAGVFMLDTGANAALTIHAPAVRKFNMLEGRPLTDGKIGGSGGVVTVKRGEVTGFVLAGKKYSTLKSEFAVAEGDAFDDDDAFGNIGAGVIKDFVLVLDYTRERIALAPRPTTK